MSDEVPCRVLLVDDDESLRDLLKLILLKFGVEIVCEASNGEEGLAAFKEHQPDIVFLDIDMPVKNGTETLKELMEITPDAFVVMLTAISSMDTADACVEAGARSYIRKGASPNILNTLLKTQLDSFRGSQLA